MIKKVADAKTYSVGDYIWLFQNVRRRSSLASGGVTDTGKVSMILGDEVEGEAACVPGKPSLVLDETERLPCGGGDGTLASSVRSEPRTTASTGAVRTDTRNLF